MKLKICRFLSAALVMVMLTGLGTAFAVFSEWSVRVEAEDGVMTGTVRTENVIGDSGRTVSFIDNGPANSLELQVTPQGGTDYIMKLRYRSGEVRDLLYQINGGPTGRISGFNSGSWNTFANMSVPVALNPGQVNTVRFFAPDGENGPGLDYVGFSASDVPPVDKPGYRLIFQDEFDGETLDDSRWVPQYLSSWAQKPELAEPTYIMENGLMRLQIFAETQPWCPEYDGETVVSGFTTGDRNALHNWNGTNAVRNPVEMQATHLNQYGYYEIRAKGQSGSARHAAWWLLGFEDVPDESAEIDIFEILGNNSHKVPVNFHAWNDPDAPDGGGFSYTNRQMDFHEEFHIYGFNWIEGGGQGEAPDKMEFYVDGVKTGERNVNIDYPVLQLFSLYEKRAGGWTGIWLPKPYPNTFDIDYVRVYKLVPGGQALPKEQLAIAEVEAQEVMVLPSARPAQYVSAVAGHEGEIFTEAHLPGVRSYVNVLYNDGVKTQEFVRWPALSEEQYSRLRHGETVMLEGITPNLSADAPGYQAPVLTLRPAPWDTNLNPKGIENLFDGDTSSTPSCWTETMEPMPQGGYISFRFEETKTVNGIRFSANYGNGQGIRSCTLSFWDTQTGDWADEGVEYTIPWTSAGDNEAGETVLVPLAEPVVAQAVRINITSVNTHWENKIVMREIEFV
ncbi:family 16 glycosylhydrolase [Ruthenibacterium lactatiformans]|uniref:family 16 glycosylhydrolase n=1 Tax=Ruthenibacterium lactatiformans TaxID=1550024 RepID=UPI000679275B|nr:family 16 glycosylhydrolase [Ruthenibacterium lactatiformans]